MTRKTSTAALILLITSVCGSPAAAQETTSYLISWVPNPEPTVAGYIIYRSLHPTTGFEVIDSVSTATTSYTDTERLKGTYYYYRLRAKDASGERGLFSNLVAGMTVPQDASPDIHNLCRITEIQETNGNNIDVTWQTQAPTIGFVQYGTNYETLDLATAWDDDSYTHSHSNSMVELLTPSTYYLRAVSYTSNNTMIISAIDTAVVTGDSPSPLSAPNIGIYPVPYHPGNGGMSMVNLPENGHVAIYNGNGVEVWSKGVAGGTELTWDGIGRGGGPVASGVYHVVTKDSSGDIINKRSIMIVN